MDYHSRCVVFYPYLNIIRVLIRRYGIFLVFGVVLLCFQGFSGYYILRYGLDEDIGGASSKSLSHKRDFKDLVSVPSQKLTDFKRRLSKNDINLSGKKSNFSSAVEYRANPNSQANFDGDAHNKGPPEVAEEKKPLKVDLNIETPCHIKSKEAISAIRRAKTEECKKLIANITCQIDEGVFYPKRLTSLCPSNGSVKGKFMGCFVDDRSNRLLKGHSVTLKHNSPSICLDLCFQRGYYYSGVEYSKECFCGNDELPTKLRVADAECDMKCIGDSSNLNCGGFFRISVIQTGLSKIIPQPLKSASKITGDNVRIAFLLTLNGRAVRQIHRLIKALYHKDHYFFIHIDSRQDFLYRELLSLEDKYPNILLSRYRLSSIWGGASLLRVLLHCMEELLARKAWKWDFVINLSESDFPIKTNSKLVQFLTANRERNFVKSHGDSTNKFLQKQGLDRTFLECETHMWRIGERKLPLGIRVDGGSDWICLNRQFVDYVIHSQDELVAGLKKVFSYTLLPAESFFHTVLRNSEHCQTFCDNNLHMTNWKRKLGCHCQYKNIVDWCGCSPNDFTLNDWKKLENSKKRNLFFARKFEPVVNLAVINKLEERLYGPHNPATPALTSYWENRYHYDDSQTPTDDPSLTFYHSSTRLSLSLLVQPPTRMQTPSSILQHKANCNIRSLFVWQVHSYHVDDIPQGLLVEFKASSEEDSNFGIETWIQPMNSSKKLPMRLENSTWLMDVQVNSNFDLKEQMFRNFGGALGPESEITVATWWSIKKEESAKPDQDEQDSMQYLHPRIVIIDSLGVVASDAVIKVDEENQVVSHSFTGLPKPLRPGHWKALVILEGAILVSVDFPVIPLQFRKGKQISVKDARDLHNGSKKAYAPLDTTLYDHLLRDLTHPFPSLQIDPKRYLSYGYQLSNWIDDVISKFYSIKGLCHSPSPSVPPCVAKSIMPCAESPWSSYSPDPKSQLEEVDPLTGTMMSSSLFSFGEPP